MEQHFQDVDQNVHHNKYPYNFVAHFTKNFNQNPIPQECREMTNFDIHYMLNPMGLMKTWGKSSCAFSMK